MTVDQIITAERLVVFDVDGTLTRSAQVDSECYVRALTDVFGLHDIDTDWSHYRHATDGGILSELLKRHRGRPPSSEEHMAFASRLCLHLTTELSGRGTGAGEIPGAAMMLRALSSKPRWAVALASGSLRCAVQLKLSVSGLKEALTLPCATGDDGESREEIVTTAITRAASEWHVTAFARVVMVGDAVWDVRAARRLGLPFIGVGEGSNAEALKTAGAFVVVCDFDDLGAVRSALDAARVPDVEGPRS